jgi:L-lactate utilization protein LutB
MKEITMDKPIENYWQIRLKDLKEVLEENNFEVFLAKDTAEAKSIVLEQILPATHAKSVSWGGSMTYLATGIYEAIKAKHGLEILDTYDKSLAPEASYELRRKSLLVDLFITGTNAVTEEGQLVNLDMIGNRACAVNFGPKHVILLIGRNKIAADLDEAMYRVKNYAGPANAMRLDKKTPCVKTSYCEECKSPDRICNVWTITEKSYPKGRIKIVLINQDLGL